MAQQPQTPPDSVKYKVKAGLPGSPQELEINAQLGDLKPWDLDSKLRVMKGRYPRLDGPAKVTGRAKYTYDVALPGMLWGRMLGAAIPAGQITKLDTSKAERLPGVKAVWTSESRSVRFAGQDVAAVAAISPEIAEEACRLIEVGYDEKPHVTGLEEAMDPAAPLVYEEHELPGAKDVPKKGNVVGPSVPRRGGVKGDAEKALNEAPVSIEATYVLPVHTHASLETHGVVARWNGDLLEVWASTQGTFAVQEGLAEALKIDRKNVTVYVEHMGGGFGSKLGPSATGSAFAVVACRLAKQAGAPVKLMLNRQQEHLCTGNAPSTVTTVRLGATREGQLTALHYRAFGSAGIAGGAGTSGPAGAIYSDCPNVKLEEHDVFTNAGPAAPLRAPGHSQGAYALESAMDELAHRLGMDPLELRRKNTSSPTRLAQYEAGAKAIGWERRNKKPGEGAGPKKRGIGMANGNWYVFASRNVSAEVKVHRDGSIEYFSGCQDIGTGFRTAMAVVVAEELGVRPADVKANIGDSRWPEGPASGGSVTTNSVAPAMRLAAHEAREKLFAVAAPLLKAKPEELDAADGKIFLAAQTSRALAFKQVAAKMTGEVIACRAERKRQFETFRGDLASCSFVEVEVDVETGEIRVVKFVTVDDCGLPVNVLTAESQVIGAMIQGASWALLENRILDRNVGTMVNPNLESYKIFSSKDMFEAVPIVMQVANAGNNTSTAGIGEPCFVATLGAVANAVWNATGARVRRLPITPDAMLAALQDARRRG